MTDQYMMNGVTMFIIQIYTIEVVEAIAFNSDS